MNMVLRASAWTCHGGGNGCASRPLARTAASKIRQLLVTGQVVTAQDQITPKITERQKGDRHPGKPGAVKTQGLVSRAEARARRQQRQKSRQQQPEILPVEEERREIARESRRRMPEGRENRRPEQKGRQTKAAKKERHASRRFGERRETAGRGGWKACGWLGLFEHAQG